MDGANLSWTITPTGLTELPWRWQVFEHSASQGQVKIDGGFIDTRDAAKGAVLSVALTYISQQLRGY